MNMKWKLILALFLVALFAGVLPAPVLASGVRPVHCVAGLMGAFDNGEWRGGPGEVSVDGKIVDLSDVESDPDFFPKLKKANDSGNGLPCDTTMLKKGRKLVYFTPSPLPPSAKMKATARFSPASTRERSIPRSGRPE